jgi:hypothetical protein
MHDERLPVKEVGVYPTLGLEAVTSTQQGFSEVIKTDSAKYVKVIKDAGIKVN